MAKAKLREHTEILRSRIGGQNLAGQKARVTGASSGIGTAVAIALAEAGAAVVVNYIAGESDAHAVTDLISSAGGRAIALRADVSNEAQVVEIFAETRAIYGTLDIVVANAGRQRDAPFEEMTLRDWNTVIHVNLTGQFLCAREAVREFLRRGPRPEIARAR
jgi:glucose 1-dehydrogenase